MKSIPFLLSFLLTIALSACGKDSNSSTPTDSTEKTYQLVWSDEFEYTGVPDPAKWSFETGGHGWGNGELQYYTAGTQNSIVDNGKLYIFAKNDGFDTNLYTSARINSTGAGHWTYGKFVVRAKLPKGKGTWPAIWMLASEWTYGDKGWPANGELDIMEHVAADPNVIHASIHTTSYNHKIGTQKTNKKTIPTSMTEFHDYGMLWTENKIEFSIDDVVFFTVDKKATDTYKEWPFDKNFHFLLNIALGGWGGTVDPTIFPATMEIEYVRVYQLK